MAKRQTDTDRSVAKLNEEIRVLQLVRDRLIAEQDAKRKHTKRASPRADRATPEEAPAK